ncbi:MAG: NAD(P)-binding domain-containing protein [Candidatus Eisenbacteria bacterium]
MQGTSTFEVRLIALLRRYTHWLHTRWPAGGVEPLPEIREDGSTALPGLYVAGDLTGIPLLKFSLDSGARVVRTIAADPTLRSGPADALDLVILGAGCAGMAAALEAKVLGLSFRVYEAMEPFFTIANFPKAKPIYTYPREMTPAGKLQVHAEVKETLLDELRAQVETAGIDVAIGRAEFVERAGDALVVHLGDGATVRARRVLVAIGRSGDFRKLGVPGETLPKVYNRLHDPKDFTGQNVVVVGGGDSALEAAMALATAGAKVTLSYRRAEFARPKADQLEQIMALGRAGRVQLELATRVIRIETDAVALEHTDGRTESVPNDVVFLLIGREAPLAFFRRSRVPIAGETSPFGWAAIAIFVLALALLYDWKSNGFLDAVLWSRAPWPADAPARVAAMGAWWAEQVADRSTLVGTIVVSMKSRSFYYTLLYTALIAGFGIRRARRRDTPYVRMQTLSLFLVQAIPLFLLPEIILPWLGYQGVFSGGAGKAFADALFESYIPAADYAARHWPDWGHPRAYWRAYGFILAWPLNVYNIFTERPLPWWIVIGFVQTFVLLPLAILRWGKGVYCGWICSCGALAETMGDTQRQKMPHGPGWNRVNMVGQLFLAFAFALLALRITAWVFPASGLGTAFTFLLEGKNAQHQLVNPISYKWFVDVLFAGVIGVGFYFKYSGRVWCRFACPLAALMHIYARFSRFAIVPEKKKCISCNVCTSVCHQGIDVMSFANRGLPMQDPECVRCSACVQSCPTGVLQFGQVNRDSGLISVDSLMASPVRAREGH